MLFEHAKKNRGRFNDSTVLHNAPYTSIHNAEYEQALDTLLVPYVSANIQKKHLPRLICTSLGVLGIHLAVWYTYQSFQVRTVIVPVSDPVSIEIVKAPEPIPPKPEVIPPKVIQPKVPPVVPPTQHQTPVKPITPEQPKPSVAKVNTPVETSKEVIANPVGTPPVIATPEPSKSEPITEAKGYAGYMSNPAPEYPEVALDRGWEGKVILRVKVSAQGRPLSIEVKSSSGRRILDDTALKTVKKWVFAPAMQGSTPVEGWVDVPMSFKLPKES